MWSIITSQLAAESALLRSLSWQDSNVAPSVAPFVTLPLSRVC